MKKKLLDNILYIVLIVLFLLLSLVFLVEYINNEKKQYEAYNDFTRGDFVMRLSFVKLHDIQFDTIRYVQLYNAGQKISKGDLIYDFANYGFIPILNYLNMTTENEILIDSFSSIMDFLSHYNSATIGLAESVFVTQPDGKYYTYTNGVYTYETKKEVISKDSFIKMYNEYLETINFENVDDNFLDKLYSNKEISSKYSYNELKKQISSNYDNFYKENEDIIISVISSDLNSFVDFLYIDYIFIDRKNNDKIYLLKDIDTDTLEVSFRFTEGDRIYERSSKYFTHNYVLDIFDVWEQLSEKGYPMLYC